jgi:acetyl esterase/lipase
MNLRPCLALLAIVVSAFSLHAQTPPQVIPLWPNGAPGFEKLRDEPEQAKDYWVKHINNPSLTVFLPPKEKATGAAVLIIPGGGHRELVFNAEGVEAAQYFRSVGVAAFVLKYRLAREENSPYKLPDAPAEDGLRAMRVIRARAGEFNINPHRLGLIGFSAGGEVAAWVTFGPNAGNAQSSDAIDRESARPDFDVFIYPGPLGFPKTSVPSDAPPAFFLCSMNDGAANVVLQMVPLYHAAKVPVEVHLYSHGTHAFNMGLHSEFQSLRDWPHRLTDWLIGSGYLFSNVTPEPGSIGSH